MLELLKAAKTASIPARQVLFDSWFSSPSTLHAVKKLGHDVIGMEKKTLKIFFRYNDEDMPLTPAFCPGRSCKRWGNNPGKSSICAQLQ